MIPRTILARTLTGTPAMEVFGYVSTEITPNYVMGYATVTLPGSGRFGTVQAVSYDNMDWVQVSDDALVTGYAGMRAAMRAMFDRAGLDNHGTVGNAQAAYHVS